MPVVFLLLEIAAAAVLIATGAIYVSWCAAVGLIALICAMAVTIAWGCD